jgi:hypothetical protein
VELTVGVSVRLRVGDPVLVATWVLERDTDTDAVLVGVALSTCMGTIDIPRRDVDTVVVNNERVEPENL